MFVPWAPQLCLLVVAIVLDCGVVSGVEVAECQDASAQSEPVAVVPFTFDGRVALPVTIKGSRELTMILDTGYPRRGINLLKPELAAELGLRLVDRGISGGAGSGRGVSVSIARGEPIVLGGIDLRADRIVVMNERRENFPPQDGILGARVILDSYLAEIDFDDCVLRLYETTTFNAGTTWQTLPLVLDDGFPVVRAVVSTAEDKEVPVRLLLDLGGRGALVLSPNRSRGIVPPAAAERERLTSGAQGDVYGKRGLVPGLSLGPFRIANLTALYTDQMRLEELGVDGILGTEVIRQFDLVLDYTRKRLLIRPGEQYQGSSRAGRDGDPGPRNGAPARDSQ